MSHQERHRLSISMHLCLRDNRYWCFSCHHGIVVTTARVQEPVTSTKRVSNRISTNKYLDEFRSRHATRAIIIHQTLVLVDHNVKFRSQGFLRTDTYKRRTVRGTDFERHRQWEPVRTDRRHGQWESERESGYRFGPHTRGGWCANRRARLGEQRAGRNGFYHHNLSKKTQERAGQTIVDRAPLVSIPRALETNQRLWWWQLFSRAGNWPRRSYSVGSK